MRRKSFSRAGFSAIIPVAMVEEKIQKVIEVARSFISTPYKYGARMDEAPNFFDCSGFIKYIFGQVGIELPRSTIEQAVEGEEVRIEELKPGDLIFVRGSYGHYNPKFPDGIGHVGIFTQEKTVIHAASKRVNSKPIIEEGAVVETTFNKYINAWAPVVVIKRVIK